MGDLRDGMGWEIIFQGCQKEGLLRGLFEGDFVGWRINKGNTVVNSGR